MLWGLKRFIASIIEDRNVATAVTRSDDPTVIEVRLWSGQLVRYRLKLSALTAS